VVEVVELVGNPRVGSRTRALADLVVRSLGETVAADGRGAPDGIRLGVPVVIELGEAVGVTFGAEAARASAPVEDPFGVVRRARLLVVATPTYKATYSGLLKLFLDQLSQGDLAGVVAVPVAIAGAPAHRDTVAAALRDLLVELGADVPAPAVALLESEVADQEEHVSRWVGTYAAALGLGSSAEPVRAAAPTR
jgi:FMN reductase